MQNVRGTPGYIMITNFAMGGRPVQVNIGSGFEHEGCKQLDMLGIGRVDEYIWDVSTVVGRLLCIGE